MRLLSYFSHHPITSFVYMLQQVEYSSALFIKWIIKLPDLSRVQHRQKLILTVRAKLLIIVTSFFLLVGYAIGLLLSLNVHKYYLGLILLTPFLTAIILSLINNIIELSLVQPRIRREVKSAKLMLDDMDVIKIAILGSYGKTTVKEILYTVLSENLRVAATPGNKNVLVSHARWVRQLTKQEKVLIFEFGEANPGDIDKLLQFSEPDIAIITGLAPAHMDGYVTLEAVANDFKNVFRYVNAKSVYINVDSKEIADKFDKGVPYSKGGVAEWKISQVEVSLQGMNVNVSNQTENIKFSTSLVGRHLLGSIAVSVEIASRLGLSKEEIVLGVQKTKPFKHRMQPYNLGGAWVIDDTYNGNLEGMKAGLELLALLDAKRKIYVTPGLVEQGNLKKSVHNELGKLISVAAPDEVVLMNNSTTEFIKNGLEQGGYNGKIKIVDQPLQFYTNLDHFVAVGDLVLMQNDWTDNYL